MSSTLGIVQSLHCTTADWQLHDRVPFWREVFGKQLVHLDIEPERDIPFEASAMIMQLPDLRMLARCQQSPSQLRRTSQLLADGDDAVVIIINLGGSIAFSQRGCEVRIATGEAIPLLHAEPAEMRCSHVNYMSVVVPHRIAAASIGEVEATAMLRIQSDTEALRLLVDYVRLLQKNMPIDMPDVAQSAASHIHDLFALTIGATRDAAELAVERGLRAARLLAIKADIQRNMADPEFRLAAVAKRAGLSPRAVQMLFGTEGSSFSQYVLESRLARAYRELTASRDTNRTIADIAYDAGFGDLSYFNRTSRRRYGASPSEIRSEARWDFK